MNWDHPNRDFDPDDHPYRERPRCEYCFAQLPTSRRCDCPDARRDQLLDAAWDRAEMQKEIQGE